MLTIFKSFSKNGITVAFPKNTFYEDAYLNISLENGIAQIHKPTIPLDKNYTLTFDVSKYSEKKKVSFILQTSAIKSFHHIKTQ